VADNLRRSVEERRFHDASKHHSRAWAAVHRPDPHNGHRLPWRLIRVSLLNSTGDFDEIQNERFKALAIFETAKLFELYAMVPKSVDFIPFNVTCFSRNLARTAEDHFNGEVEKPIATSI
jgi:hypothetical protein